MIRKTTRVSYVVAACLMSMNLAANRMVNDTKGALNSIRSQVVQKAKNDKKKMKLPSWMTQAGMRVLSYDAQTRSSAAIARPFFVVKRADSCLQEIGSPDDIAYLKSVFTEFYASSDHSMYKLITILHRHMMQALGLPATKTIDQFKHMIEKTNKHDYPVMFDSSQFVIYCRCVARGLYAVYWFEHGLS